MDKAIALEGLVIDEARDLLLKAARIPVNEYQRYKEDATTVARLLQSHPLALIQAGAYVSWGHCTLANYPRIYQEQRQRLLTFRPTQARSRYCDVYATFEVSAGMLSEMNTETSMDALQLLPLLAVCGPSQFPSSLFEAGWWGAGHTPSDLDENFEHETGTPPLRPWQVAHLPMLCMADAKTWDPYRLMEAVACLKSFALVSTTSYPDDTLVSFHPLVHAWARDRQDQQQLQQSWLRIGCLTDLALRYGKLTEFQDRQLQPHVEALVVWPNRDNVPIGLPVPVARILTRFGLFFAKQRADVQLSALLHAMFTALELGEVEVEREWMDLYRLAARNCWVQNRYKEAVLISEKIFELRKQALPRTHKNCLTAQNDLAHAYSANGQITEAITLLEEVVEIQKYKPPEHSQRLASQHSLAMTYLRNGQVKEAISLLEEVVEIKKRIFVESQSSLLASQHGLAIAYRDDGQFSKAILLLKEVVEMRRIVLAEDHPDRLNAQHGLAMAYRDNGQVTQAVALLEEAVEIGKTILSDDHFHQLRLQEDLAITYRDNGQVGKAVALLEKVDEVRERIEPEDHRHRLPAQEDLAIAYRANKQIREAVALLEKVVEIRQRIEPEDQSSRLVSQHWLAVCRWEAGNREAGLSLMAQVVNILKQSRDESHYIRRSSELWLADFEHETAVELWKAGEQEAALSLMAQAVEIGKRVLDEGDSDRQVSEQLLADWKQQIEDLKIS